MNMLTSLLVGLLLAAAPQDEAPTKPEKAQAKPGGPLFIVGGGGTPDTVKALALEMAGGKKARVLIFPQASERKSTGRDNADMWKKAGAKQVKVANLRLKKSAKKEIERADLIWFAGGSQNRLMEALREGEVIEALRARHLAGAVLGGTSAGAAVMSKLMITGEAESRKIVAKGTELADGLGLVPGTIIDQHFHARRRFNRLLSAVLDNPKELGIGIDERTAIVVRGRSFEVVGESGALVIDANSAKSKEGRPQTPLSFTGVVLHHIVPGEAFDLETRQLVADVK
jgi:cyanophycinase